MIVWSVECDNNLHAELGKRTGTMLRRRGTYIVNADRDVRQDRSKSQEQSSKMLKKIGMKRVTGIEQLSRNAEMLLIIY